MLKILIYDTNYVKGISRVIPITKIKYWQEYGCKISILCTKEGEEFYRSQLKNIDFISIDYQYQIRGPYSLPWEYIKINTLALLNLKRLVGKFNIVYSQSSVIDFLFIPWILKFFDKKIRWFAIVDNIVPFPSGRPGPFLKKFIPYLAFLLGNILLRRADGIFVVTDFLKRYYQNLGMKSVIKTGDGYGIETEIFKGPVAPATPKANALYCGRLHLAKGILDLVEVVKLVAKQQPGFKIGILGNGEEEVKKEFYKKIKQEKLVDNFLHFGYRTGKEKGDILRKSDFLLFLSYDEGCPHAVIEAFACNKPVVAYDLPTYHDVFAKYIKNGQMILFKQKDFKGIANFILHLSLQNLRFDNKLEDFKWDKIVKEELKAMKGVSKP